MAGGKSLATMNELYKNSSSGWNYVVNFVYINFYEYLTAELYVMVTLVGALWVWKRRCTRKRMRKARKSHVRYYKYSRCGARCYDLKYLGVKLEHKVTRAD